MTCSRRLLLCAILAVLAAAAACAPPPRPTADQQVLYIALLGDPKSLNPVIAKETSTTDVTNLLMEGLTRVEMPSLEVKPALAESWQHDNSGTVWTFRLRENLRWNDGQPLTAADVVFTFNDLIYNPDIPTSSRDILQVNGKPFRVTAPDSRTVVFTLAAPYAPFLLSTAGLEILPEHILRPALAAGKFNETWGVNTPPAQLVGAGMFRLKELVPGQKVVVERNPYYWRNGENGDTFPKLARIVMTVIPDQNSELLKFKAGELDYIGVRGEDYAGLQAGAEAGGYTLHRPGPTLSSLFVFFNQDPRGCPEPQRTWFRDVRFRRAVAHAVDRATMVRNIFHGLAQPAWSDVSPGLVNFHNPNVTRYEYDLAKAGALLDEAGYRDRNGDGIREDERGNRIKFTLVTNSESSQRVAAGAIIGDDLKKLGFDVTFTPMQFNALISNLDSGSGWEACIMGLTGTLDPHNGRNVWHSSGQLHMWQPRQARPATDWEAEIDSIFDRAVQELDPAKRKALYWRWQEISAEQVPMIYTVVPESIYAVRNRVGGVRPAPFSLTHNLDEWYIR